MDSGSRLLRLDFLDPKSRHGRGAAERVFVRVTSAGRVELGFAGRGEHVAIGERDLVWMGTPGKKREAYQAREKHFDHIFQEIRRMNPPRDKPA